MPTSSYNSTAASSPYDFGEADQSREQNYQRGLAADRRISQPQGVPARAGNIGNAPIPANVPATQGQTSPTTKTAGAAVAGASLAGGVGAVKSAEDLAKAAANPFLLAYNLLRQVDLTEDWMFVFILAPFGLLKDLVDIAFAAIPGVGIIVSFVATLMLFILTVTVLLLTGSGLKARGQAKYFIGMGVGFISEALPGIDWLPLAVIEIGILYLFVLYDRAQKESEQK